MCVDTFEAILILKTNIELSCEEFRGELAANPAAPRKIHSQEILCRRSDLLLISIVRSLYLIQSYGT
jgi:hypothetical protein